MKQFTFTVTIPGGIHARPASALYARVRTCSSSVSILKDGTKVNARRLTDIMKLNIRQKDTISFLVEGDKEQEEAIALQQYCQAHL